MSMIRTLGRMLLAYMFISGGASTFANPEPRAAKVSNAGVPRARQAAILNGAVMVVAGSALALGLMPKVAATVLVGSLIPTTLIGHPFWEEDNPGSRAGQQIHFLKNISMIGGLLLVIAGNGSDDEG